MGFEDNKIRTISVAIVRNGNKILALSGYDCKKDEFFYRLLGGGVDFGELSEQALVREFKEELGVDIKVKSLIKVVENIFNFEGKSGHEVCFVYDVELLDKTLYEKDEIPMIEKEHNNKFATWVDDNDAERIYPIHPSQVMRG